MFKHVRSAVVASLVALFVLSYAAPALAAPSAWSFVDVGLHLENGQPLILVSGDLPEDVPLPYEAELAVPSGTQLQWIGEILGGPPAEDPQLQYVKTTVGDMDIYKFTLTKSRTAQFEGISTGMTGTAGEIQNTTIKWTAWQDLPSVRVSQRLPRGAQVSQASDGASMQAGDETYSRYSKTVTNAKAGDVVDLTFSYTLPISAPSAGSSQSSTNVIVTVFMGAAALLLLGIVVVSMRQKAEARSSEPVAQAAPPERTPARQQPRTKQQPRTVEEPAVESTPRPGFLRPQFLIAGVLIMVVVVAVSALSSSGSVKNGKITKFFGSTSPCSSTSLVLMPNPGVDLAEQGKDIVDAFSGYDGIGDVTLTIDTSTLDVTFCESSHTEESVRQIVEGTGLVSLAAAPIASAPATATIDPTGTKQTATVDTSSESFDPGTVILKAGLPSEIAFGQAAGCITEVVFTTLGITQPLSAGQTIVTLPALEPGTYAFACAMGHQTGSVIVQ